MTNYKEEQKDEIEALEAIYPNEIKGNWVLFGDRFVNCNEIKKMFSSFITLWEI